MSEHEDDSNEMPEDQNDQEDDNHETPSVAETYLAKYEKRVEQGLGNYPHSDSGPQFVRLGDDGKPYRATAHEVLRAVSSWYVKKDNKFHEVNNLEPNTPLTM